MESFPLEGEDGQPDSRVIEAGRFSALHEAQSRNPDDWEPYYLEAQCD